MIALGDIVTIDAGARQYEVTSLLLVQGKPHAIVRPLPPGAGPSVPVALNLLAIVSKGGLQ